MKDHEESFVHRAACATMARTKRTNAATSSSLHVQKQQLRKPHDILDEQSQMLIIECSEEFVAS